MSDTAIVVSKKNIVKHLNSKTSKTALFAKWFYNRTWDSARNEPNGKLISAIEAAKEIRSIRDDEDELTLQTVQGWITKARNYCEANLGCTIWNERGIGWRTSTEIETARVYGRCIGKTIGWAERTRNLGVIVKREHIPHAIREVLGDAETGITRLQKIRSKYVEIFTRAYEEEKIKNVPKAIT